MPMFSFDVLLQSILRLGFDHLRAHPEDIEEIFGDFKTDHLWKAYGQEEIDRIKQWVTENEIPIVLAWALNPAKVPCISLQLAQSTELVEAAGMDDFVDYIEEPKNPRTVIEFVPTNIIADGDQTIVVPPNDVDISLVRSQMLLVDSKNEQYLIGGIASGGISVVQAGEPINPTKVKVVSFVTTTKRKRRTVPIQEVIDIGIHGHADQNTVLWMYYLVIWILLRFKPEMEKRCADLSTFSASDFNRDSQFLAENVFSRFIRVSARTRVTWLDDPEEQIDTLVATVKVEDEND
jgi:hypothetical protein